MKLGGCVEAEDSMNIDNVGVLAEERFSNINSWPQS